LKITFSAGETVFVHRV